MRNAESLATVYIHTSEFTNEQTLVAFWYPEINRETNKVTHT